MMIEMRIIFSETKSGVSLIFLNIQIIISLIQLIKYENVKVFKTFPMLDKKKSKSIKKIFVYQVLENKGLKIL